MKLIIITGTPGVGKTNASRMLARKIKAIHIDLNEIVMNEKLIIGYDRIRKCSIADFGKLSRKIEEMVKKLGGKTTILDGHYTVLVSNPDMIDYVFVLRCDPEELENRLKNRGYPQKKIVENVMAEILGTCLSDSIDVCGKKRVYQINATKKNPNEVVSEIIDHLKGEEKEIENIDWISEMERNGNIEKMLNYERQLLNNI